mgnify:CR=1 FL=1
MYYPSQKYYLGCFKDGKVLWILQYDSYDAPALQERRHEGWLHKTKQRLVARVLVQGPALQASQGKALEAAGYLICHTLRPWRLGTSSKLCISALLLRRGVRLIR